MAEWIALRQWLDAPATVMEDSLPVAPEPELEIAVESEPIVSGTNEMDDLLAEIRFFRATLDEAVERHARILAQEIAVEVLARELRAAPCDLVSVVQRACARYHSDAMLSIRVHPDDVAMLSAYERVVADETLRCGDALIELSDGMIDATLGVRLERVLRAGIA